MSKLLFKKQKKKKLYNKKKPFNQGSIIIYMDYFKRGVKWIHSSQNVCTLNIGDTSSKREHPFF